MRTSLLALAAVLLTLLGPAAVVPVASAQPIDIAWTEIPAPFVRATDTNWARMVSFDGNHIVVGGPGHVDVYEWDGAVATFDTSLVATSGDSAGWGNDGLIVEGGRIFVQARESSPPPPALYGFENVGGVWTQVTRFTDPVATTYGDRFFGAFALEGDRLVLGVPYANDARGFTSVIHADAAGAFAWTVPREARVYGVANFELSGSCADVSGDRVLVGTMRAAAGGFSQTGRAVLYRDMGTSLSPIAPVTNPTPGPDDQFGGACALLPDGFVVGARYDDVAATDAGAVYVYDDAGGLVQTILGPGAPSRAVFGAAMSVDGSWLSVGAPTFLGSGVGSIFLYRRDASGTFVERARIMNFAGRAGSSFGGTISLHGNVLVVGDQNEMVGGATNAGRAWVGVITEPDGGVCDDDAECTSGHCVDGICCNTACTGACFACGTGTCTATCDAGAALDAGTTIDAGIALDAGIAVDAGTPLDASTPSDAAVDDAGAPFDAGPMEASVGVDAGGTARIPFSCTCRAGGTTPPRGLVALLGALALAVASRRERR